MPSQRYLAGVATDRAAKEYQRNNPGVTYEKALHAVIREATHGHQ
jgi:hypothetical protein